MVHVPEWKQAESTQMPIAEISAKEFYPRQEIVSEFYKEFRRFKIGRRLP
jgi:hypothetical protein